MIMKDGKKNLKGILPYLRPYVYFLSLAVLCSMANGIITILITCVIKNIGDKLGKFQFAGFYRMLYVIAGLVCAGMILTYLESYTTSRYLTGFIKDLRDAITVHLVKLPVWKVHEYHSGEINSRFNNDISAISDFIGQIPHYMYQPVIFIGAFFYMLTISWKLLLSCTILIPISSIIFDKINMPIQKLSKKRLEAIGKSNAEFSDMINGIYVIKSFNLTENLSHRYGDAAHKIEEKSLQIDKLNAYLYPVFLALRFIPQLICPIYGGYLMMKGEMTTGGLMAFLMLIWYVFMPVEEFLNFISRLRVVRPAVGRVFEIMDIEAEHIEGQELKIEDGAAAVEFNNVSFSYDKDDRENKKILDNISFKIGKGKITALAGHSGCGKSTILNLLCSFYKCDEGSIKLYGNDIKNCNMNSMRRLISVVSQSSYLFPATVFENIAYGRPGASRKEVIEAAKAANAHEFIVNLPQGYDTHVSERGKSLSGGQCQRIALARAILKDAPILLLDEPTSALDIQSEALLMKSLKKFMKGRTVIVIAHRLSTIADSDEILVINDGKVYERGTHKELMENHGIYSMLYTKNNFSEAVAEEA